MSARISTRLILAVAAATALTIGIPGLLLLRAHRHALLDARAHSARQVSETIKSSTHHDMLEHRRDNLVRQIQTIGAQEEIESVRVFNKEGRIVFSSEADEVGRTVDKQSASCVACHRAGRAEASLPASRRSRIFRAADGTRVLGVINPIYNQPGCATACHAHSPKDTVLGVLDVGVSLAQVDRDVARSESVMAGLLFATLATSGLLVWWLTHRLVVRPVQALAKATRRVAAGDLTAAVNADGRDEVALLARSFNEMTRRLGEAQQQLAQADKLAAVGRLGAGIAHEINNPLTAVLTYASFWHKRVEGNPALTADLDTVVREAKRCREIVKGLLDFARQSPPQRRLVDLDDVVARAASVVAHAFSLGRVRLELQPAGGLPAVSADPGQIQQVIVNLLMNATDAVADDGTGIVRVTTRADEAGVEVVVEDNGAGIPDDIRPHLFEPFFTTKGTRGTGLGLSVTWGIVHAHDGTVVVESEVGRGSRFRVRLPRAAAGAAEGAA